MKICLEELICLDHIGVQPYIGWAVQKVLVSIAIRKIFLLVLGIISETQFDLSVIKIGIG